MGTNKSKKQKRFQKFVEKQVKKDERAALLEKLSTSTWKSELMRSSKNLGRQTETKREKLHRAALEEKLGLTRSDPSVQLYVSERDPNEVGRQADSFPSLVVDSVIKTQQEGPLSKRKRKRNKKNKASELTPDLTDDLENSDTEAQMTKDAVQVPDKQSETTGVSNRPLVTEISAGCALATATIVKRKRQKKGHILKKLGLSKHQDESDGDESADEGPFAIDAMEVGNDSDPAISTESDSEFDSSASESDEQDDETANGGSSEETASSKVNSRKDDESKQQDDPKQKEEPQPKREKTYYTGSMLKPLLSQRGVISAEPQNKTEMKAYYVNVKRDESIQEQRMKLPVYAEEQQIMEAIVENPVIVLSGETGSGKTTQVPQFLFEAGYGDSGSPNPGMIGITQPRRVAAVSMSSRVAEELGDYGSTVAHQVRFDTTVSEKTRIKFMTEGVLLREMASDLLLTKYSVLIIDEAHERSLNTDILLGVLSRVVRLRHKMAQETPDRHRPLKLVIMSATLRVDDFVKNSRLFSVPPPVINVQARQHPVRVHFNRRTPAPGEHLSEVVKKVGKIHQRLPSGGILVFLTGQAEITYVCKMLRAQFPTEANCEAKQQREQHKQSNEYGRRQGEKAHTANGLEASIEDEDVDIGDIDLFSENGDLHDDFALDSGSESDSEEEEELILGGDDDDDARNILLSENLKPGPTASKSSGEGNRDALSPPLYVLPLYSLLPADQQLKVFAPPPPGCRLCVVATNVAETSITIPGIRYVVDTGLAKEKTYDSQTQVQTFEVGWTSQASANQRMGRAGRTGPGHCYRIFSSAVFNDQFVKFSEPEIMRMPIEGVVLQMKAMCLDNVVNFPFPTPPSRPALSKAERLLSWLGALDAKGCITDLGRLMSVFPVAPRFAKMLIIGQQHGCLPYVIAIVAGLSVGDPFVKEFSLNLDNCDDTLADLSERDFVESNPPNKVRNMDSDELAAKEHFRAMRKKYWSAQAKLAGADPTSDILKWLTVIGAFEYSGGTEAVCAEYFVRPKAMNEIRKLRGQLTNLVQMYCPGIDISMDPRMPPPSKLQQSVIRQIVLAGFLDHVAVRGDIAGFHSSEDEAATKKRGIHATPYVTMWSDEPVFVHPESVSYIAARKTGVMPQAIVFSELQHTTRLWAKVVTIVNTKWLATIGQSLCTFGNPLPYPIPKYNEARDHMTCYVEPRFGPKSWELSMVKVEEKRTGTRWQISKVIG
ncbi:putative ATP-dependent RNA helicase DHR1 [Coemansia sp. RSA 986]|nr:putative ATP-dependent RNA helicase DHR1 [Coemansia sp. RSA 986]